MEDIVQEINQLVCIVQELDKITRRKKVVATTTNTTTTTFSHTNDTTTTTVKNDEQQQQKVQQDQHVILSHYTIQQIPESLKEILNFLYVVVTNINNTVTKITLLKHAQQEQLKLCTLEIVPYCQHLSSICLTIVSTSSTNSNVGCCLSMKQYYIRAIYSIVLSIVRLLSVFCDNGNDVIKNQDTNFGAPETGAVWDVCSIILQKKLPTCNRAAMRRDLLTFQQDCNDTITEFEEIITISPTITQEKQEIDNDDDDDQQEEQELSYTNDELPIVHACIGLLKCSKNCLLLTATICDAAAATMLSPPSSNDTLSSTTSTTSTANTNNTNNAAILSWIGQFHEVSYLVGNGVTDLGSCLYPPLIVTESNSIIVVNNDLQIQINQQIQLLENVITFINKVLPISILSSSSKSLSSIVQGPISDTSGSSSQICVPLVTRTTVENNNDTTITTTTSVGVLEDDLNNLTISANVNNYDNNNDANHNNNSDNNDNRFIINFPNTVQEQIKKLQQAIQIRKQNVVDALMVVGTTDDTCLYSIIKD